VLNPTYDMFYPPVGDNFSLHSCIPSVLLFVSHTDYFLFNPSVSFSFYRITGKAFIEMQRMPAFAFTCDYFIINRMNPKNVFWFSSYVPLKCLYLSCSCI